MNEQQKFWAEKYASDYIQKNSDFDEVLAVECWKKMLSKAGSVTNLLECGCNIGRNIGALTKALPAASKSIIEISQPAFEVVLKKYPLKMSFNGSILDSNFEARFDLVLTMGVLIHIHPDHLVENMRKMFDYSEKYILIGEYFNRTPVMIKYQGEKDRLFKRDFGKFFMENFPVRLVDYGFLWGHLFDRAGFDDITYWLFEKEK